MFNSKNEKTTGSISKVINPGTVKVHLLDLFLEQPSFGNGAYQLQLQIETEPIEGEFAGLPVDKNRPELGNYKGQVARIKAQPFLFSDYVYNGVTTSKERQLFKWLIRFSDNVGKREMLDKINADTIEAYVEKAKTVLCDPENWFWATIAGEEYDKAGSDGNMYLSYRLLFPKTVGSKVPFHSKREDVNFMEFDPATHIRKKKVAETVQSFGSSDGLDDKPSAPATPSKIADPFADDLDL